jgi:uncharacterized protein
MLLPALPVNLWDPDTEPAMFRRFDFDGQQALYHIGSNSVFAENHPFFALHAFLSGATTALPISDSDLEDVITRWTALQSWERTHIDDVQAKVTQIAISPTLKCNLSCNYCYNFQELPESRIRKLPSLGAAGVKKILSTLSELPLDSRINVAFIGGEPLLNPKELEHLIRVARRVASARNIKVNFLVTTNGLTLGRQEIVDLINKYKIGVSISLDGPREWHNETRHLLDGRDSYDRIARSIEFFLKHYHSPYRSVRATHKLVPGRLIGTYRHVKALGFNDIAMGSSEFDNKVVSPAVREALYEEVAELSRELESDMISGAVARHSWFTEIFINLYIGNVKQVICGATRNHVAFDVLGGMQACHRYLGNDKYELTPDDINNRGASSLVSEITRYGKTNHCHQCWARSLCGGECFHVGKEMHRKPEAEDLQSQICDYKRLKFKEGLRAYFSIMNSVPDLMPRLVYGLVSDAGQQDPNTHLALEHAD